MFWGVFYLSSIGFGRIGRYLEKRILREKGFINRGLWGIGR